MGQITAETIARSLGGGKEILYGDEWRTICPLCKDQERTLDVTDKNGKLLVNCHKEKCNSKDIVAELKIQSLWPAQASKEYPSWRKNWDSSSGKDLDGVTTKYFKNRGISIGVESLALRLHPNLYYSEAEMYPAIMLSLVDVHGNQTGIHRTYLCPKTFQKAPVSQNKKLQGKTKYSVVRLDPVTETISIGEGLETMLAVKQATKSSVWVATSASGLANAQFPDLVKTVRIWADLDKSGTGERAAKKLAKRLLEEGRTVYIHLPEKSLLGDNKSVDWLDVLTREGEKNLIQSFESENSYTCKKDSTENKKTESQSTRLVEMLGDIELFHSLDEVGYARINIQGHKEVHKIDSNKFKKYLRRRYYEIEKKALPNQALLDVVATLDSKAQFEGKTHEVHLKIGGDSFEVEYDLTNSEWESITVNQSGWKINRQSNRLFYRSPASLPSPKPEKIENVLEKFRGIINIPSDDDFALLLGWMAFCFNPMGPYPILMLSGEQGCAKSSLAEMIKMTLDPSKTPRNSLPKTEQDLAISAMNSRVLCFDNISGLSPALSDAFCRVSTGGGFSVRKLYTDDEEKSFEFKRPVVFNGIDEITSRPDLSERSILITLPTIAPENRLEESFVRKHFDEIKGGLLEVILQAASTALSNLSTTEITIRPRMIDFVRWASAAETAFGFEKGFFCDAYQRNIKKSDDAIISGNPIAEAIQKIIDEKSSWRGTASLLLQELLKILPTSYVNSKACTKNPATLSRQLRRIAPTLRRSRGIDISFDQRDTNSRWIYITRVKSPLDPSSSPSQLNLKPVEYDSTDSNDAKTIKTQCSKIFDIDDLDHPDHPLNQEVH